MKSRGKRDRTGGRPASRTGGAAPAASRRAPFLGAVRRALTAELRPTDPALLAVTLAGLAAVLLLVTTIVQDTDLWTLLAQGRAIVADPHAMKVNLWTWPDYGAPMVAASWLFRVVLWPLWAAGGVLGVFAWRWLSALAVFLLLFAAARRMGARGLLAWLVLVACALTYRMRADARPESLAAILFALSLWILETRRAGGADRSWWLVPIALVWANAHVTVYLLFVLIAAHLAGDLRARRGARGGQAGDAVSGRARLPLWGAGLLAALAAFVQPSGWHALWQPFQFALFWRYDPMFSSIEELHPLRWAPGWRSGTPVLIALWPVLILLRAGRRRLDVVEALLCAAFTALAWTSLRFLGVWAMAAAPFMARDLGARLAPGEAPGAGPAAGGAVPIAHRSGAALGVALAIAALTFAGTTRPDRPFGVGIAMRHAPVHAADFIAAHGIRGRTFNQMQHGGYLAFRFPAERERLPFVTTQPELSTAAERANYYAALRRPADWYALDHARRFDYVLLDREQTPGDHLLDVLDMDSTWVMVFGDDAAELYVRRAGPFARLAAGFGYRVIPGGRDARGRLMDACQADPALRARARAEAERMADASPANGAAHQLLGFFALMDGRNADAARHLARTVRLMPQTPRIREILGDLALARGRGREARHWYREERSRFGANPRLDAKLARARPS